MSEDDCEWSRLKSWEPDFSNYKWFLFSVLGCFCSLWLFYAEFFHSNICYSFSPSILKVVSRMCVWMCLLLLLLFCVAFIFQMSFLFSLRVRSFRMENLSPSAMRMEFFPSSFLFFFRHSIVSDCIPWYRRFDEWGIFKVISHGQIFFCSVLFCSVHFVSIRIVIITISSWC